MITARAGRRAIAVLALLAAGCVDPFLAPEPSDDPEAIFDLLWSEIDAYYAYFAFKPELDWNQIRDAYRPRVEPGMADGELAELLGEMMAELQDGHADLITPFGRFGYQPFADRPSNYAGAVTRTYLTQRGLFAGDVYEAGWVGDRIGYVRVAHMRDDGTGPVIDAVLGHLDGAEALVVDVRDNPGGTDDVAEPIAARFYDQPRIFRTVRYRNGPAHDDFTEPRDDELEPAGARRFAGPVALLTNRGTFSSGETLVVALRTLPNVVIVGDTTGGGAGNPIHRELPNGWRYRVPRWVVFTADGFNYEGIGLPPDVALGDTDAALAAGHDLILETAMAALEVRLGRTGTP